MWILLLGDVLGKQSFTADVCNLQIQGLPNCLRQYVRQFYVNVNLLLLTIRVSGIII
jgi:hypothetical protein